MVVEVLSVLRLAAVEVFPLWGRQLWPDGCWPALGRGSGNREGTGQCSVVSSGPVREVRPHRQSLRGCVLLSGQTKAGARREAAVRHLEGHTEVPWSMKMCSWCSVPGTRCPSCRALLSRVSTPFGAEHLAQRRHYWLGSSRSGAYRLLPDTAGSDTSVFVVGAFVASAVACGDTVAGKKSVAPPCVLGFLLECQG